MITITLSDGPGYVPAATVEVTEDIVFFQSIDRVRHADVRKLFRLLDTAINLEANG